jgi:hypothetical protein
MLPNAPNISFDRSPLKHFFPAHDFIIFVLPIGHYFIGHLCSEKADAQFQSTSLLIPEYEKN